MDQAMKLKTYYDELVKKHKRLVKVYNTSTRKDSVDMNLPLELQTIGESINEFTAIYGTFIRRRNSSYGRFQVDNYVGWLQRHGGSMLNNNMNNENIIPRQRSQTEYNMIEIDSMRCNVINQPNQQYEKIPSDLTHIAKEHITKIKGNSKKHTPANSRKIANKEKEERKTRATNAKINKKPTKKKSKQLKNTSYKTEQKVKNLHNREANDASHGNVHFVVQYPSNNNFSPMNNETNNEQKNKPNNLHKKVTNYQELNDLPYSNFYTQNTAGGMGMPLYNSPDLAAAQYHRNEMNKMPFHPQQHNMQYSDKPWQRTEQLHNMNKYLNKPNTSVNTQGGQKRKYNDNSIQYINPSDIFQDTVQKNNKQKQIIDRKNMNMQRNTAPEPNDDSSMKEEPCKFIEPTSVFKTSVKEEDEQCMGRHVYKTVYGNDNPTDEELTEMNEMYDIYLETICNTSCMIAKANNKTVLDEEDIRLAIKMEFDVIYPDDVTTHPVVEIDADHEKKIAMIAKERRKKSNMK